MAKLDKVYQLSWRKFLSTEAGQAGILFWKSKLPVPFAGDPDIMIFHAGVTAGYVQALDLMTDVIGAEPEKNLYSENQISMER